MVQDWQETEDFAKKCPEQINRVKELLTVPSGAFRRNLGNQALYVAFSVSKCERLFNTAFSN
jgi:hypothetical protein